jgi:hypothetical protein
LKTAPKAIVCISKAFGFSQDTICMIRRRWLGLLKNEADFSHFFCILATLTADADQVSPGSVCQYSVSQNVLYIKASALPRCHVMAHGAFMCTCINTLDQLHDSRCQQWDT